jgi:hypothetical protein
MTMKHWMALIALAIGSQVSGVAQESKRTTPDSIPTTKSATTNAPVEVKVQVKRYTDAGRDLGAFIVINAGDEAVGFQMPENCRMRSEGRAHITITEGEDQNNSVTVYHSESAAFSPEDVRGKLRKRYSTAKVTADYDLPVVGTNAMVIELAYGVVDEPLLVKTVTIPCHSGELTLVASTTTDRKTVIYSLLNKIMTSLQLAATEKDLRRPNPVLPLSE